MFLFLTEVVWSETSLCFATSVAVDLDEEKEVHSNTTLDVFRFCLLSELFATILQTGTPQTAMVAPQEPFTEHRKQGSQRTSRFIPLLTNHTGIAKCEVARISFGL